MILEIKIDRKRIFLFFRLIIIPVTRYSSRLVRKDVARVKETLCFSPRVRWFDRYLWGDLYKQTHQRRGGLLEGNPRGRRYVHCVSSWNKQDVSLPIYPGDAGHHFSFQKNIPMGIEMNGPPLPSCCPPSLPEDVLDYCPRNNDSRNKNRPSRKYHRGRGPRSIEKRFFRVESFLLEKKMVTFRLNFRQWKYYPNRKLFGRVIILWTVTKILFPNYPLELFFYSKNRTRFSFPPRITNCVFHSCVKRVESFVRDFVIARSIIFFRGGGE